MRSETTILGAIVRQTAVLLVTLFLFWMVSSANAAPLNSSSSAAASDQILLIQGSGALAPVPSVHFDSARGGTFTGARQGPFREIQLWPGTVSYTRVVDWAKPFLQSDLHLGIDYTYQFNFQLRARDADSHTPAVPDGWYELDMAVVMPQVKGTYLKTATGKSSLTAYERFVTSRSMLILVSDGVANRQITFRFPNLSATTIANHLYISFTPIQKACVSANGMQTSCIRTSADGQPDLSNSVVIKMSGYKPYLLDIPFVPFIPAGAGSSNPDDAPVSPNPATDANLPAYIAAARTYQAALPFNSPSAVTTPQEFATRSGLVYLLAGDKRLDEWAKYWRVDAQWRPQLMQMLHDESLGTLDLKNETAELWSGLCAALVMNNQKALTDMRSTNPVYNSIAQTQHFVALCSDHAPQVFRLTVVDHVYRFDATQVTIDAMQPMRYSISTNFMVSRSHSRDSFNSFSPLEILYKAFDVFGLPLRALGIAHSVTQSDGQSQNESTSGSITMGLDFNVMPIRIPLARWQRCLEVRPVMNPQLPFYDNLPTANTNGLYICDDIKTTPRSVGEIYAHVFAHSGDTSLVDSYSPLAQSVNIALQGDRDIAAFFALTRQALTPVHDSRIFPAAMLEKSRAYFAGTPTAQPGLIVHPVRFFKEDAPSFTEMVFGVYKETFVGAN